MFNKIIVGLDGLGGGRDALALADRFSSAAPDAAITLVSAYPYDPRPGRSLVEGYEQTLREGSIKGLQEELSRANHEHDDRYSLRAVPGRSPGRALQHVADEEGADLIIVGSCRHGLIGRVFLGDASRSAIRDAPCAVAVAPRGYRDIDARDFELIGVGYNGTKESETALQIATSLARERGATLHLLTAVESPRAMAPQYAYTIDWTEVETKEREAAERLLDHASETLDLPLETEIVIERAGKALERLSNRADLVVVGSRGAGPLERVAMGSTSDWLVHHSDCPVLVIPRIESSGESTTAREEATHV